MNFSGDISLSFVEEVDKMFRLKLQQQGPKLMNYVTPTAMYGDVQSVRLVEVEDGSDLEDIGSETRYDQVRNYKRLMYSTKIKKAVKFDDFAMLSMGDSNFIDTVVQDVMIKTTNRIDDIILRGIYGPCETQGDNRQELGPAQTIEWDDNDTISGRAVGAVVNDMSAGYTQYTWKGLNSSKITKAVAKIRKNYNSPDIFCVCSEDVLRGLKADPIVVNSLTNYAGPALSIGAMFPFGGVLDFVTSERIPTGIGKNGQPVSYAYVFCKNMIEFGTQMPIGLEWNKDASSWNDLALFLKGSYGCARAQEVGVVKIECAAANATVA